MKFIACGNVICPCAVTSAPRIGAPFLRSLTWTTTVRLYPFPFTSAEILGPGPVGLLLFFVKRTAPAPSAITPASASAIGIG